MSSTAVAEGTGPRPTKRATKRKRGWRSHWAVRVGVPGLYLAGTAIAIDRLGLPYSQDWIFIWIVGLMVAISMAGGEHSLRRLVTDWLPIIVALLAYDLLRGVADGNLLPIHWQPPVDADKILGLGQVPTVRLQDALYTPGHLHSWDYAAFSFWFSHFFATLLVAVGIWLYRHEWFSRFAACIVALAAMGLVTYVLFPAAPPWLAADHGYIDHTYRITHAVVNNLPVPKAGALFQKGTDWGNDVAAVPSLHAAYTMLICLFLWPRINRRWRPLLVAYPIGMGLSLIYLGEHYLIDILLGWVYAAVAVYLVNWGFERWGNTEEATGSGSSRSRHRGHQRPLASRVSFWGVARPLLAVDTPSMLFRAFYALPKSIKGPDGNPVNALLGTANLILREVEAHNPRAVVLCFGPDAAAYRLELFPAYHADREAAFPDELRPQWDDSGRFLRGLRLEGRHHRFVRGRRPTRLPRGEGEQGGRPQPPDDRRPGHVPVREREHEGALRQHREAGRPADGAGRGEGALRDPAQARPRPDRPPRRPLRRHSGGEGRRGEDRGGAAAQAWLAREGPRRCDPRASSRPPHRVDR